jgi:FkbM family methyltransferase
VAHRPSKQIPFAQGCPIDTRRVFDEHPRVARDRTDWFSHACVGFYVFVHGRLHLPGAGWLLRRCARAWRGLQEYPYLVPHVGTAKLDLRDDAAFGLINMQLGELGNEAALLRAFQHFTPPAGHVWDIGANVGHIAQALVRPPLDIARLDCFEPSPVALRTLQSLFENHPKCRVHPIGLGAKDEMLTMSIDPRGSTLGSLVRELPQGNKTTIPVRRGDEYRVEQQLPMPDLVKIDVEGFEPQVLAGLQQTIREARPIIIFEHIWLSEEQVRSIIPERYELVFLLDNGTISGDFAVRFGGANAALVPIEKQALLNSFPRGLSEACAQAR